MALPKANVVEITPVLGQIALDLTLPSGPALSAQDQQEAERRYKAIRPLLEPDAFPLLWAERGGRRTAVVESLAKQYATAPRTLYHWLAAWRKGGLPALVRRERSDKGRPKVLTPAALDFLVAAALPRKGAYGELSVAEIYRAYLEERAWRAAHAGKQLGEFELRKYARYLDGEGRLSQAAQLPAASYETFRTWFDRIPEAVRVMARQGEDAFANTQEIISFRNLGDVQPLDYVVMDHRRLDIFCMVWAHEWRLVRPWITAAIDMRTRKWLAWAIVQQPSSDSIATVLKRAILDFGAPAAVYWDNGKDFTCEWLEGRQARTATTGRIGDLGDRWRGVLDTLGIRVHHAIVKRARSKLIEPNFLNIAHFDRTLPWWCGHKPSARPQRFAELLDQHERWLAGERPESPFPPIERIADIYDAFIESLNERDHSGEGMQKVTPTGRGWMSPNEAWDKLIPRVERRAVPAEVLQFCFQRRRTLTVRNGEVRMSFHGRQYHYRLADNHVALMRWNGREIEAAYDPLDLGTIALYCEGRLLGLAHNIELRGMGEDAFVADERDRRAARREIKRFVAQVHRAVYIPSPEERLARRAAVRPARIEPQRIEAPARVPQAIADAASQAARERSFRFADAGADLIRQADARSYRDDDPDDEFDFFQGVR